MPVNVEKSLTPLRDRANKRLGLKRYPENSEMGVPFPIQLDMPGTSIVKLIAGGMYVG